MMSEVDRRSLKTLVEKSCFIPYSEIPVAPAQAVEAWMADISHVEWKNGKQLFVQQEEGRWVGAASLESLPFDTELYGFPMAKIGFILAEGDYAPAKVRQAELLKQILRQCGQLGIAHLAARVAAEPAEESWMHLLELNGFYKVAAVSMFALELGGRKISVAATEPAVSIRPYEKKDLEPLCEISRLSFGDPKDWLDKAHADTNLPKEKSDELYVRWFRNCTNGTRADQVLVAEADGKPVGYIALKLEKGGLSHAGIRVGIVELNAVSPEYRRRGIYRELVRAGLGWFSNKNVDWVTIKTQSDTAGVHKVWTELGAIKKEKDEIFYHKFFGVKP